MKVAIVCGAPSTEFDAPYDDESWEIWVLGNRLDRHIDKRVSRVFEIHDHIDVENPENYKTWLKSTGIPLVVSETFGEGGEVYPYERVEGLYGSLYLTSSPAYMMGYALLNGATDIAIYGVDLSIDDHEYFWQRPCMESWIGFAKGRGVNVYIPDKSHIGKSSYVEGRDWNGSHDLGPFSPEEFQSLANEHSELMGRLENDRYLLEIKRATHDGAKQAYERMAKVARAMKSKVDVRTMAETTVLK